MTVTIKKPFITTLSAIIVMGAVGCIGSTAYAAEETSEPVMNKDRTSDDGNTPPKYMSFGSHMQGWSLDAGVTGSQSTDDIDDDDDRTKEVEDEIKSQLIDNKRSRDAEAQELANEQKVITDDQQKLAEQIKSLYKTDNELEDKKQRRQEDIEYGIKRMARVYEQMPARSAAVMFNIMDMRVMVPITQHMNPRKVSVIMGNMNPDRANILSQYLAGIRQLSPDTISKLQEQGDFQTQAAPDQTQQPQQ